MSIQWVTPSLSLYCWAEAPLAVWDPTSCSHCSYSLFVGRQVTPHLSLGLRPHRNGAAARVNKQVATWTTNYGCSW